FVALEAQSLDLRGLSRAPLDLDALTKALQRLVVDGPLHLGHVNLGYALLGMSESLGELAIVGAEQRAAGVKVEAPYRDDARSSILEQLTDRGPAFGIAQRAHHATRLVQHDVHQFFGHDLGAV